MKRGFLIIGIIAMLAMVSASCVSETVLQDPDSGDKVTLRLEVEDISTGVQAPTRATIPAEIGESEINGLHLLFYENSSDGSGSWVKTLTEADLDQTPVMNGNYELDLAANGLSATTSYTILALANAVPFGDDTRGFLNGQPIGDFISILQGETEKQAIERTYVTISGVDIVETDDTRAIRPDNLFMSTRSVYTPGESTVLINLTRGVARFDVYLDEASVLPRFELVSASVWGAAERSMIWYDRIFETPVHTQRFYGVKNNDGFTDGKIVGGLYSFENYVAAPEADDRVTTCVIIGIRDITGSAFGTAGKIYYYRINVHQMSSAQDLRRNNVYKLRVNSVDAAGEDTEYGAWSQSKIQLTVSVNEWHVDDNGMVITDGTNTMVLPVKLVRLDPKGDARDFSIFTIGSETLAISKNGLPSGIDASLSGSLLQVTATALAQGQGERRGSIEISYGSLRGTISFIQSPDESVYMTLNRYEVPNFAPTGRGGVSDRVPFEVTASGPWTARIYNMDDDAANPGFSFNPTGAPVTSLRSAQSSMGDMFQVYTTGDNPSNNAVRNGFIMVTLDSDPVNYSRVVVLAQDPKSEIVLNPDLPSPIRFSPAGLPLGVNNATAAGGFVFDINPGKNAGGVLNTWSVSPKDGDTAFFEIEPIQAGSVNRFIVRAKGTEYPSHPHMNLSEDMLMATFTITAGSATRDIIVFQNPMEISISTQGTNVPKTGGLIGDVTVNIDPTLHWVAEIVSTSTPTDPELGHIHHDGYLSTGGVNRGAAITAGQTQSTRLKAGFGKVYYPLVNHAPRMTVKVSLAENPDVSTTFTVTQDALIPAPMNILDVRNTSYGSLTGGTHYLSYYRSYLGYASMFGPSGKIKTATPLRITGQSSDPSSISSDYVYLHVGGRPGNDYTQARHSAVNEWFAKYGKERLLYYFMDDHEAFDGSASQRRTTVLSQLGITGRDDTGGDPILNTGVSGTPIYRYLVNDGPFGPGGQFHDAYVDGVSVRVHANTLPSTAVPLIVDDDNPNMVFLFIDPVNNLIFQGESQIFDTYIESPATTLRGGSTHDYANLSRFLANLQAYVINASQYGSHYTELFLSGNEDLYDAAFVE